MGTKSAEGTLNCQEGRCDIEPIEREMPHHIGGDSESMHSAAANCN